MAVDQELNKTGWLTNQGSAAQSSVASAPFGTPYHCTRASLVNTGSALWVGAAALEGSVDNSNWVPVLTLNIPVGGKAHQFTDQLNFPYLRVNVTSVTTGNVSVDASLLFEGRANN